jgi:hypothetical protein
MLHNSPTCGPKLPHMILILRDHIISISAFIAVISMPFYPQVTAIIGLLLFYFIVSQFKQLPFYRVLRHLGFHCYLLQYSEDVIMNNEVGQELLKDRTAYQYDYMDMGYTQFNIHAGELIRLDIKFRRLQEADEILEPYF